MKSLNQVEPRTPIGTLPFTITQPGSYYFTKNLEFTAVTGDAITVNASNVTLDLMGFTLSSTSAVTGSGIAAEPGTSGLTVKNGRVAGTTTVDTLNTVKGGFERGVNSFPSDGSCCSHITNLTITGCRDLGLFAARNSIVENVLVTQCARGGILTKFSVVRSCNVFATSGGYPGIENFGGSVSDSVSTTNQGVGVKAATISNVTSEGNSQSGIIGELVHNCHSSNNGSDGIVGSQVANCMATGNDLSGIRASGTGGSITHSLAHGNGSAGIIANDACNVTHSLAQGNGGPGISIVVFGVPAGVVAFCTSSGNTNTQIDAPGTTQTGNSPAP